VTRGATDQPSATEVARRLEDQVVFGGGRLDEMVPLPSPLSSAGRVLFSSYAKPWLLRFAVVRSVHVFRLRMRDRAEERRAES